MRLEGKSLKSDFLRFIIPSIIAQWVFSLYTMVDGIFVAMIDGIIKRKKSLFKDFPSSLIHKTSFLFVLFFHL